MKLLLPLGLIGLVSVLALILIYIFKPKYQDRKVSSTYVWKLSLQYQKRKVPMQWLQNSLLLLIQILILALIAFTMAEPYIVLASKNGEKIAILDASASMMAGDGESRFERAKKQIASLADGTVDADRFSIILAADEASFLIRRSDSAAYIKQKLFEAECGYGASDLDEAMELAEGVLEENPSAEVYLFTDKEYLDSGPVKVVDLSDKEWNAAVLDFRAELVKGKYVFTAEIASYGKAAEIPVSIEIDGKERLGRLADCAKDGTCKVVWDSLDVYDYTRAEIALSAEDRFGYDNTFVLFNDQKANFRVQFVSADTGFLYWALSSVPSCNVTLVTEIDKAVGSGFDLYVYNSVLPAEMPQDGAVWFVDPPADLASVHGFRIGGEREGDYVLAGSGGTSEACRTITRGIWPSSITLSKYSYLTAYTGYESVLTCDGSPVLLAKNENGLKTLILAFNIHWSNLPVLTDFPRLIGNMCSYSLSPTVEKNAYLVGEEIGIHTKPNVRSVSVKGVFTDGGESEEIYTSFPVSFPSSRTGVYTVTQTLLSGEVVTDYFTVRSPQAESVFGVVETTLTVPIVSGSGTDASVARDTVDIYVYLAAALLVLLCIEWGLQYREQ